MTWRPEWYDDSGPRRRNPFAAMSSWSVTATLIAITVAAWVVQKLTPNLVGVDLTDWFGLSRATIVRVYPLVTYMFLHDPGGIWHILFNMMTLWFFGRPLEDHIGARRLLALYFGAGIVGGIAQVIASHAAVIGASGGCLGVLIYFACSFPDTIVIFIMFPIRVKYLAMIFVGADLFAVLDQPLGGSTVARLTHLAGAAYGFLFWRYQWDPMPRLGSWSRRMRQWQSQRDADGRERKQAEVDRILKKIYEQGLPSLTEKERRFMEQASRDLRDRH